MSFIKYNPNLKERARYLRNNSTSSEIKLWKCLHGGKMLGYIFNRQKPLDEYIVDFYCKKLRLVIEVDGDSHMDKKEYDLRRQKRLEDLGLTVIRFYNHDIKEYIDGVLTKIEEMVRELEKKHNIKPAKW